MHHRDPLRNELLSRRVTTDAQQERHDEFHLLDVAVTGDAGVAEPDDGATAFEDLESDRLIGNATVAGTTPDRLVERRG